MQNFRLWIVALLVTFTSCFQFGYHTTYVNTAIDAFKEFVNDSYHYSLTEQEFSIRWTLALNMFTIGCMVGVLLTPYAAENFGRRNSIIFCSFPSLIAIGFLFLSVHLKSYLFFCIGRLLIGISSGISINVQSTFLVECAPIEIRGKINCLPEMQLNFLSIVGFCVGLPKILGKTGPAENYWKFYVIYAIGIIPALIPFIYFLIPESPKFLFLIRKNSKKALKSLQFFNGKSVNFEEIFEIYREEKEKDEKITFKVGLKYALKYRKATFIGTLAMVTVTFAGVWAIYTFSTEIFMTAGFSSDFAAYGTVIMSFIGFIATIGAIFAVETIGRRPLMLGSFAGCLTFGTLYAVSSLLHQKSGWHWCKFVALISVILVATSFDLGIGPISWYFAQEITPQSCRSLAGSFASLLYWMNVYATGIGFYPLFEFMDAWAFLLMFMFPLSIGFGILYKMIPETKGKTMKEILLAMGYTNPVLDFDQISVDKNVLKL